MVMKEQLISLESKSFGCMLEWLFLLCKEGINKNGAEMRLSVKAINLSTINISLLYPQI